MMAGELWQDHGLVFASRVGTPLTADNVIRAFRIITEKAGLGEDWVPREMRHTFVSVLSASGVPVESFPGMIPARFRRPRCQRAGRMLADHDRAAQHSVRGLGDEIIPEPVALVGAGFHPGIGRPLSRGSWPDPGRFGPSSPRAASRSVMPGWRRLAMAGS
jgi:hypothetical protein